ncbi:Uncharacterized protein dnm_082340 [Desulfonema magnum]|uniref:Uncharacterized protein n=1 Tax=Desulfonema magnum TaxID=45655 RepID=A0A975GTH7_9BACT|nr:Uncharacterized protein dnm_082340 [Desulfonema magnum]
MSVTPECKSLLCEKPSLSVFPAVYAQAICTPDCFFPDYNGFRGGR